MENHISVVIPLFNKQDTVVRALNSVLNQTLLPREIIVVNDGSTDGSVQEMEKLNNSLIKLIHQTNAGVSAARNKGIKTAKGDWIAFLDADDEWLPEYLETIHDLAATNPHCKVLATLYYIQNQNGIRKQIKLKNLSFKGVQGELTNYFEVASKSYPPIWTSAVVVDKSAIVSIGGFPLGIKAGEDLLTWARLAVKFKIAYSTKELSIFILDISHIASHYPTRLPDMPDYVGKELKKLMENAQGKLKNDIRKYLSLWYKMRASVYLRMNDKSKVWHYSCKSLKYNCLNFKNYLFLTMSLLPKRAQLFIAKIYTS